MASARAGWIVALLVALCAAAPISAQEEPLVAGGEGVPVPKKTKHVQPVYPKEALTQGIRGIVILDIVVDGRGKVASTSVLRSVPGLDEAAIGAARQWEYQPTKVDGKPVSVRLTVPITFTLALPSLQRQTGVPELRQGANPAYPDGESGAGSASVEVTLEPDGRIGVATLRSGEPPWSTALLAALKTWRFSAPPDDAVLSFRVEADFVRGRGSDQADVVLRATGLQRSELLAQAEEPETPAVLQPESRPAPTAGGPPPVPAGTEATPAGPGPEGATPPATAAAVPAPPATEAAGPPPPAEPMPDAPAAPALPPTAEAAPEATAEAAGGDAAPAGSATSADGATAPPPVEVLTPPPPALPPENGISAIREVTLEPGVPDLARGRRPVAPPLARMARATGTVEVLFSVGAGGSTTLQSAAGPEQLRYAAEQTVGSWVFRRTRADRAYLVGVFSYDVDKATAVVRPQSQPPAAAAPEPASAPPQPPPAAPATEQPPPA